MKTPRTYVFWRASVVVMAAMIFGCGDWSPTGSTSVEPVDPYGTTTTQFVSADGAEDVATDSSTEGPGACDTISIRRAGIRWQQATIQSIDLFVPVEYDGPGQVWVHVWHPELNNGVLLATGRANETFRVKMPEPCTAPSSSFDLRLAVEVDLNGDRHADDGLQCDRHRMTVTLKCGNGEPVCPACLP